MAVFFPAKGKSGCPVRPPEQGSSDPNKTEVCTLLDTQQDDNKGTYYILYHIKILIKSPLLYH